MKTRIATFNNIIYNFIETFEYNNNWIGTLENNNFQFVNTDLQTNVVNEVYGYNGDWPGNVQLEYSFNNNELYFTPGFSEDFSTGW